MDHFGHFFETHILMDSHMHETRFNPLSYVSLIISTAKEPGKEEEKLPSSTFYNERSNRAFTKQENLISSQISNRMFSSYQKSQHIALGSAAELLNEYDRQYYPWGKQGLCLVRARRDYWSSPNVPLLGLNDGFISAFTLKVHLAVCL